MPSLFHCCAFSTIRSVSAFLLHPSDWDLIKVSLTDCRHHINEYTTHTSSNFMLPFCVTSELTHFDSLSDFSTEINPTSSTHFHKPSTFLALHVCADFFHYLGGRFFNHAARFHHEFTSRLWRSGEVLEAAAGNVLMEESSRRFKDGAATEREWFSFPQIKFWCQAWSLVGKHLYPAKHRKSRTLDSRTFDILSLLWILFPRRTWINKHEHSVCSLLTPSYRIKQISPTVQSRAERSCDCVGSAEKISSLPGSVWGFHNPLLLASEASVSDSWAHVCFM